MIEEEDGPGYQYPVHCTKLDYFASPKVFYMSLLLLVALTVADGVLVVVLFDLYTETYSQYLNQSTAFVYGITTLIILACRKWGGCCLCNTNREEVGNRGSGDGVGGAQEVGGYAIIDDPGIDLDAQDEVKEEKEPLPWSVLITIGFLNGSANFCMAIAQPHTPGLTQVLLYLLGIPLVMVLSYVFLHKKSSPVAITAAVLIVGGTAVSGLRTLLMPDDGSDPITALWYSVLLFAGGQFFLGGEKVYEEHTFARYKSVDVMKMFCVTLWTQFMLGWLLYPVQTVGAFGGLELSDLPYVIRDGVKCTFGVSSTGEDRPACDYENPVLFFIYCTVDFCCYAWGLFVIQKGGAKLMVLASAIALPIQQLVLCLRPLMGMYVETFFWGDAVALVMVLGGFCVYQFLAPEGVAAREKMARGEQLK